MRQRTPFRHTQKTSRALQGAVLASTAPQQSRLPGPPCASAPPTRTLVPRSHAHYGCKHICECCAAARPAKRGCDGMNYHNFREDAPRHHPSLHKLLWRRKFFGAHKANSPTLSQLYTAVLRVFERLTLNLAQRFKQNREHLEGVQQSRSKTKKRKRRSLAQLPLL